MTTELLPQHKALLKASAIGREVAAKRGYFSVTDAPELLALGFGSTQTVVPALAIPVWGVDGTVVTHQVRPDTPRTNSRGKTVKYELPVGQRMVLDVHPLVRDQIRNPDVPLFITEGARKVDAAVSQGVCCIGVLGVWNWRGTNSDGGKTELADWEAVALKGRKVLIAFDSDVTTKPEVAASLERLEGMLERRGAKVKVLYIPGGPNGEKVGLDDYLAAGGTLDELAKMTRPPAAQGQPPRNEVRWVDPLAIPAEDIDWLLPKRIPLGMPTLVVGNEGEGKSLLAAWLCAQAAVGKLLDGKPVSSLYCSAEDHTTKTIGPRLRALDCPPGFVSAIDLTVGDVGLTVPDDVEIVEARIEATDAKLVIFDPLVSYLSDQTDSHRDHSVRRALVPLAELAARRNIALVLIVHTNKSASSDFRSRIMGSKAFNAFARLSLLWAVDPDTDDANTPRRILAHAKQNLTERQESLAFEVQTRPVALLNRRTGQHVERPIAHLKYVGTSAVTEEDMLSDGLARKGIQRARAFLLEELYPPGHWYLSAPLVRLAGEEGISPDQLRRAREQVGVTRKDGNVRKQDLKNITEWRLPPDYIQEAEA